MACRALFGPFLCPNWSKWSIPSLFNLDSTKLHGKYLTVYVKRSEQTSPSPASADTPPPPPPRTAPIAIPLAATGRGVKMLIYGIYLAKMNFNWSAIFSDNCLQSWAKFQNCLP